MAGAVNWKTRSDLVNSAIWSEFFSLRRNFKSQWGLFNGCESYSVCGLDDHRLVRALVRQAHEAGRTSVVVMDLGAGNFQWVDAVCTFARRHIAPEFPSVHLHVVGVRGERYAFGERSSERLEHTASELAQMAKADSDDHKMTSLMYDRSTEWGRAHCDELDAATERSEITQHGATCTAYKFGACCIERFERAASLRIFPQLRRERTSSTHDNDANEHDENVLDLVVSNWCVRHLVDPVGTLQQVYDRVRRNGGWLVCDGPIVYLSDCRGYTHESLNKNATRVFRALQHGSQYDEFLTCYYNDTHSLNHFALRRRLQHHLFRYDMPVSSSSSCSSSCDPVFVYAGMRYLGDGYQVRSGTAIVLQCLEETTDADANTKKTTKLPEYNRGHLGDQSLFEWTIEHVVQTDENLQRCWTTSHINNNKIDDDVSSSSSSSSLSLSSSHCGFGPKSPQLRLVQRVWEATQCGGGGGDDDILPSTNIVRYVANEARIHELVIPHVSAGGKAAIHLLCEKAVWRHTGALQGLLQRLAAHQPSPSHFDLQLVLQTRTQNYVTPLSAALQRHDADTVQLLWPFLKDVETSGETLCNVLALLGRSALVQDWTVDLVRFLDFGHIIVVFNTTMHTDTDTETDVNTNTYSSFSLCKPFEVQHAWFDYRTFHLVRVNEVELFQSMQQAECFAPFRLSKEQKSIVATATPDLTLSYKDDRKHVLRYDLIET